MLSSNMSSFPSPAPRENAPAIPTMPEVYQKVFAVKNTLHGIIMLCLERPSQENKYFSVSKIEKDELKNCFLDPLGRYKIIEYIGKGAEGVIVRVDDKIIKRQVVAKVMPLGKREYATAKNMVIAKGANVPNIHDCMTFRYSTNDSEIEVSIILMEDVGDITIKEYVKQLGENGSKEKEIARFLWEIAGVIARIHNIQGTEKDTYKVHCDVKAENIHIYNNHAYLLDWNGLITSGETLKIRTLFPAEYKTANAFCDIYCIAKTLELLRKKKTSKILKKIIDAGQDPSSIYFRNVTPQESISLFQNDLLGFIEGSQKVIVHDHFTKNSEENSNSIKNR